MTALPLSILALAAGVYLLIKVNREYLGGLFKFFAWLVIVLSLVSTAVTIRHGVHHFRMRHCEEGPRCEMHKEIMIKEMHTDGPDSICPMAGCKMAGDSVVLDRAMCEKMMGKEACDKLCKERGQCIMTKDECAKMCGAAGKACCVAGEHTMPGCCKGGHTEACCKGEHNAAPACCKSAGSETKACCKK